MTTGYMTQLTVEGRRVPLDPPERQEVRELRRILDQVDFFLAEQIHMPWLPPRRLPMGQLTALRADIHGLLKRLNRPRPC